MNPPHSQEPKAMMTITPSSLQGLLPGSKMHQRGSSGRGAGICAQKRRCNLPPSISIIYSCVFQKYSLIPESKSTARKPPRTPPKRLAMGCLCVCFPQNKKVKKGEVSISIAQGKKRKKAEKSGGVWSEGEDG
jgi:hypothetical protein